MNQEKIIILSLVFGLVSLLGFYLAYLYGRKTKIFKWSEYLAIIILPIFCIIALAFIVDFKIFILFGISSLVGSLGEYTLGFVYHKTLNKRLWTYERLSFDGYSSLLITPVWGIAGVVFWLLSKIIGL